MLRHLKFNKNIRNTLLIGVSFALLVIAVLSSPAAALSGNDFNPGRIIDDSVFYNPNTMTADQIQQFLTAKIPVCDTNGEKLVSSGQTRAQYGTDRGYPPPYTCLKDYRQDIGTKNPEDSLCNGISAASSVRASEIIYRVAQSCGVSPKVLLVLLQKEQSLVTDDWPWSIQYRSATGYGCPDTAPCDSEYYGFFNQVYNAARIYKYYAKYPSSFNHIAGRSNYILYNPNHSCGGTNVFIQNQATAGLYNYTPYQPNPAALNNLYGTGDGCSAYGNRNFWRMYTDWFGTTYAPAAIKTNSSPAVYMFIQGNKYQVPSMAVLQDHGVSPTSIKTISQEEFDSIQSPSSGSGLSSSIGFLVKSSSDSDDDGGTVYLVSIGKRYKIKSYDQFLNFGFTDAEVKKLPLSYIISLSNGGTLSDFISSVSTNNVFKVESARKRIIFSGDVHKSQNPSGAVTQLSNDGLGKVSPGDPIHNTGMFIRQSNGAVYFFNNENTSYHIVPNMEVFNCWGVSSSTSSIPYYQVARSSFFRRSSSPKTSLGCAIGNPSDGKSYIMRKGRRYTIPSSTGLTIAPTNDTVLASAITKVRSGGTLSRAVGSTRTSTIWYLEDGLRKPIPNMRNLTLLGFNSSSISYVDPSAEAVMPISSHPKLASSQVVKSPDSGTVYAISGKSRIAIKSAVDFSDSGYRWEDLETYNKSLLDAAYPWTGEHVERFVKDKSSNSVKVYGGDGNCYDATDGQLVELGIVKSSVLAQSYDSSVLAKSACKKLTLYVKSPNSPAVYFVDNGKRHAFRSYESFRQHNVNNQAISTLSSLTISSLPSGPAI